MGKKRKKAKCEKFCGDKNLDAEGDNACMDECMGGMAPGPGGGGGLLQRATTSMPGPPFFGPRQPKSSRRQQGSRTIQRRTYRR